jgi:hypothetical protein
MPIVNATHETQANGQPIEIVEYWELISRFKYDNRIVLDPTTNSIACELVDRLGVVEVLRRNGPEFYRFRFGHSVISYGSKTNALPSKIQLFDGKGKLQKVDVLLDQVNCDDNKRRTIWSFTLTQNQSIVIEQSSAEVDGLINWDLCTV